MNVVFRTDASTQISTGHVMRCLTLAEELHNHGTSITFICREHEGNLCNYIEEKGFSVFRLPAVGPEQNKDLSWNAHASWLRAPWGLDAGETAGIIKNLGRKIDWIVIDHYALDGNWEQQLRPLVDKIMVIDDLADRPHDCDVLLDQNLYEDMESRYDNLVPETCQTFLGPRYALLRPEFRKARKQLRLRDGNVRRILVFFGGSDLTNETTKALKAIQRLNRSDIAVDVIVGSTNPHREEVRQFCETMENIVYHCNVDNMAELMARADLAIGAGGATSWERCCVELPAIIITLANNQEAATRILARQGAISYLGRSCEITAEMITDSIDHFIANPQEVEALGCVASKIIEDRNGVVEIGRNIITSMGTGHVV